MPNFTVVPYQKENGDIPIKDFLNSLDVKMRAKMYGLIGILKEKGNQLREPYSKNLDDGIFELRCKVGRNITRVLYFFYYKGQIVLTNGFVKKTQKTPPEEVELAKKEDLIILRGWKIMITFDDMLNEQLQDPEFRKEYEAIQPEMDVIRAIVDARISQNLTQKELSERSGINQADISKIENGTRNPSLNLLKRLADGMGMTLKIEFVPKQQA